MIVYDDRSYSTDAADTDLIEKCWSIPLIMLAYNHNTMKAQTTGSSYFFDHVSPLDQLKQMRKVNVAAPSSTRLFRKLNFPICTKTRWQETKQFAVRVAALLSH